MKRRRRGDRVDLMPLSVLTAVELFRTVSARDMDRISRLCVDRHYAAKTTIFARGDPGDSLFLLKEGVVRICSVSEKGGETILLILKPDAIFGELLFSEETRSLTAIAGTDVIVTILSRENFREILRSVPSVAENFIRLLSRRLSKVERGVAEFGHTWSYDRLAQVLLHLAEEHGIDTPAGTRISLRVTHEDLAKLIGTTRETATTQINRFRRRGLLKREGRFFLVDRARLAEFLRSG